MENRYVQLKRKQEEERNNFPMAFAFSDQQFKEAMEKLGLKETDTDKVYSIGGGGIIRKTDSEALSGLIKKHDKEMKEAIANDDTGEGFIFEMFSYELANHEYGYTRELEPTLDALGFTFDEVNADTKLLHGLNKARREF
jgi:hypothetical protein